jgi:hypothetical protein
MTKQAFWNWFYNSASIMWARFQVLMGCVVLVITMTDMSQWLPAKAMPIWLVINGVIAEYLRRSNTQMSTIEVNDRRGIMSEVTYLKPPNPIPVGAKLIQVRTETAGNKSIFGVVGVVIALTSVIFMLIMLF